MTFEPTRAAGLKALADFLPKAGGSYAARRNYDLGAAGHPHVSRLSPWMRHRLVSETEVLRAVLGRHSASAAEKFIQEVYWRTYWKGWLEMRPGVWRQYRDGVAAARNRLATEGGLRRDWEAACTGDTGIDCFDHWARELVATGYLHNHARMWFASIWVFTLRLPWELGADFFLRHLLDGDPASNTLGWRWVAGIQTPGKTYLARPDNIARYTEGRFDPRGQLAEHADPIPAPPPPPRMAAPTGDRPDPALRTGWLMTEDDLLAGFPDLPPGDAGLPLCLMPCDDLRSPLATAPHVRGFTAAAMGDAAARHAGMFAEPVTASGHGRIEQVLDWAATRGLRQVVMPHAPAGPAGDACGDLCKALAAEGIALRRILRPHDARAWPHATHGFFRFKEKIPALLADLGGLRAA
ncbi:FAD-binding domain-containing protein [Meridianimarinicoccus sp. RP-17]|uniref:FAD-binding domain-containing protein n=1 Tax=Meridianimarinicoccus zhengii TaxID=2056810 RepID=UPI000DAC5C1A|nr:FAD-binding domain-containing protein [Phycocomes zhengii]